MTGATGAIGRNLIKELKQETSHTIRILTRTQDSGEKEVRGVEKFKGDLRDIDSLFRACFDVDTIIHLSGITHAHNSSLYDKINRVGSENLIHAAEGAGIKKFIFLSSKLLRTVEVLTLSQKTEWRKVWQIRNLTGLSSDLQRCMA